jgi:peptide/nickel transport system ATP-binding protein
LLNIHDLNVVYHSGDRQVTAVRDVSLQIQARQVYGLVGESGSGKTSLALAVLQSLGAGGTVIGGGIEILGRDVCQLNDSELRAVWGEQVALVPQDPLSSLNPSIRLGEQLAEGLRWNLGCDAEDAHRRVIELFEWVHIADAERVAASYPHQLSGGMQQRVMIAMALSREPDLLVLDEPTTGLDATTEAVVLDLFRELIRTRGTAALYVSHNLGVVAQFADRVAVMYAGELVEDAPTTSIYRQPLHPYTSGLIASVPRLGESKREIRLQAIKGQIPSLENLPSGCVFEPRCPLAIDICLTARPPLDAPLPGRRVRCYRWPEILAGELSDPSEQPPQTAVQATGQRAGHVLKLQDLTVHFPLPRNLISVARRKPARRVRAVERADLTIGRGQTLGLVGESGSGKTTLAKAIVGLVTPERGQIELLGAALPGGLDQRTRATLRQLQMIFQNPEEALNPHLTIGETLKRPLISLLGSTPGEAQREIAGLLEAVRLPPQYASRFPAQLSGGEQQRVAIARAFAAQPELLIADEPVSALDVSVQAAVLNLLNELQQDRGNAIVFISHDIAVVGYLADRVAVMYLGHLMDVADAEDIFAPPYHPYTEALLSAIPLIDPGAEQATVRLRGEVPSAVDIPGGCPFHPRCPRFLGEICVQERPPWRTDASSGRRIYCHIPVMELRQMQKSVFQFSAQARPGERPPGGMD